MKRKKHDFSRLTVLAVVLAALSFLGCAHDARPPAAAMDNPEHHVFSGDKLLATGDLDGAAKEYRLALELDPKHAPALYGTAIVLGRQGDFAGAGDAMKGALRHAGDKTGRARAHAGFIRLHTLQRADGWYDQVGARFEKARLADPTLPDVFFYKGLADEAAGRYADAEKALKQVLALKTALVAEADTALARVQKVRRAMPGTDVGRRLAGEAAITRADAAAVFVHELRLEKLFAREGKPPGPLPRVRDIGGHPLQADIETVLRLGLRGLELGLDERFAPDATVTRAAYALMIEDIIATVAHDERLRMRHIGQPSPFPDVPSGAPYFNAVLVTTSRGVLTAADMLTGAFDPQGTVSGADALLAIRILREKLRVF